MAEKVEIWELWILWVSCRLFSSRMQWGWYEKRPALVFNHKHEQHVLLIAAWPPALKTKSYTNEHLPHLDTSRAWNRQQCSNPGGDIWNSLAPSLQGVLSPLQSCWFKLNHCNSAEYCYDLVTHLCVFILKKVSTITERNNWTHTHTHTHTHALRRWWQHDKTLTEQLHAPVLEFTDYVCMYLCKRADMMAYRYAHSPLRCLAWVWIPTQL